MGLVSDTIFKALVSSDSEDQKDASKQARTAMAEEIAAEMEAMSLQRCAERKARRIKNHLLLEGSPEIAVFDRDGGVLAHHLAHLMPYAKIYGFMGDQDDLNEVFERFEVPENLEYGLWYPHKNQTFDAAICAAPLPALAKLPEIKSFFTHIMRRLNERGVLYVETSLAPENNDSILIELDNSDPESGAAARFVDYVNSIGSAHEIEVGEEEMARASTRAFTVPVKWAYEFVLQDDGVGETLPVFDEKYHHMNERAVIAAGTLSDMLSEMGGRAVYAAPVRTHQKSLYDYHLFTLDGQRIPPFPESHAFVVQKITGRQTLKLAEKEPARSQSRSIHIRQVQDEKTGHILNIAESLDDRLCDVLPYRLTSDGRVHLFLTESVPRCLSNVLTPSEENLDGRRWSGHMTEAISLVREEIESDVMLSETKTRQFMFDETGLITQPGARFTEGPSIFPAPDLVDEMRPCYFVEIVRDPEAALVKKLKASSRDEFAAHPVIRELDAQNVLDAISCGLIPNARLEIQITALFRKLDKVLERQAQCQIPVANEKPQYVWSVMEIEQFLRDGKSGFKEKVKQSEGDEPLASQVSAVRSRFIGEGKIDDKITDMTVQEKDFILHNEGTQNTAVILPLTRNLSGEVLVGMQLRSLPIPQRHTGQSGIVTAPSLPLPPEVTSMVEAAEYVAKFFKVMPDRVAPLGQSFFSYIDMMPHRIYPFAVASAAKAAKGFVGGMTVYAPIKDVWRLNYQDQNWSFLKEVGAVYMNLQDSELKMSSMGDRHKHDYHKPDTSCPACYNDLFMK